MYSNTTILGNVGRDPEMRFTPSGTAVCSFSVATSETFTKDGQKTKRTTWFKVTAWGKLAEVCNQYVKKGMLVFVSGRLVAVESGGPKVWTDKGGSAKASFELNANEVKFLTRSEAEHSEAPQAEQEFPF